MIMITEHEQRARDKHEAERQERVAVQRGRAEMSDFYANQIADAKATEQRWDTLVGGLRMILADEKAEDRKGSKARSQMRAVEQLLGRLT